MVPKWPCLPFFRNQVSYYLPTTLYHLYSIGNNGADRVVTRRLPRPLQTLQPSRHHCVTSDGSLGLTCRSPDQRAICSPLCDLSWPCLIWNAFIHQTCLESGQHGRYGDRRGHARLIFDCDGSFHNHLSGILPSIETHSGSALLQDLYVDVGEGRLGGQASAHYPGTARQVWQRRQNRSP